MDDVHLWVLITVGTIACIIGIAGNGLVIYFANKRREAGAFRHLNKAVRNLAITDFLYSICAAPLAMVYWIWRKI